MAAVMEFFTITSESDDRILFVYITEKLDVTIMDKENADSQLVAFNKGDIIYACDDGYYDYMVDRYNSAVSKLDLAIYDNRLMSSCMKKALHNIIDFLQEELLRGESYRKGGIWTKEK